MEQNDGSRKATKKRYEGPILSEYGSIIKLTEGGPKSTASDHGANMMTNMS